MPAVAVTRVHNSQVLDVLAAQSKGTPVTGLEGVLKDLVIGQPFSPMAFQHNGAVLCNVTAHKRKDMNRFIVTKTAYELMQIRLMTSLSSL
jgi:hypothetical protein